MTAQSAFPERLQKMHDEFIRDMWCLAHPDSCLGCVRWAKSWDSPHDCPHFLAAPEQATRAVTYVLELKALCAVTDPDHKEG